MDRRELKREVRQMFNEGLTSPLAKERLMARGLTKEQADAIALDVINEDIISEEAQDTYRSTLLYGAVTAAVGLIAVLLTLETTVPKFESQLNNARWLLVPGLGLLFTGYRKWKIARKNGVQ